MDSNLLTITSNMLSHMSYHVCLHALLRCFLECYYCCCRWFLQGCSTWQIHPTWRRPCDSAAGILTLTFQLSVFQSKHSRTTFWLESLQGTKCPKLNVYTTWSVYISKASHPSHWSKNSLLVPCWVKDPHSVGPLPAMQVWCSEPTKPRKSSSFCPGLLANSQWTWNARRKMMFIARFNSTCGFETAPNALPAEPVQKNCTSTSQSFLHQTNLNILYTIYIYIYICTLPPVK